MLSILLFMSVLTLFLLITVSTSHTASPLAKGLDATRQQIKKRLMTGNRAIRMDVLSKHQQTVVNTAIAIGVGLGILTLVGAWFLVGYWALILAVFASLFGIVLTDMLLQNEYKQLQEKMLEGVPAVISFVPAFLEVGSITPREAIEDTLAFTPEPFKSEIKTAIGRITRTGNPYDAFATLQNRIQNPVVDAICSRLSSMWDAKISSDVFDDLGDQVDEIKEMSAIRAVTAKNGFLVLILLVGLIVGMLLIAYPGAMWMLGKMSGGFI